MAQGNALPSVHPAPFSRRSSAPPPGLARRIAERAPLSSGASMAALRGEFSETRKVDAGTVLSAVRSEGAAFIAHEVLKTNDIKFISAVFMEAVSAFPESAHAADAGKLAAALARSASLPALLFASGDEVVSEIMDARGEGRRKAACELLLSLQLALRSDSARFEAAVDNIGTNGTPAQKAAYSQFCALREERCRVIDVAPEVA